MNPQVLEAIYSSKDKNRKQNTQNIIKVSVIESLEKNLRGFFHDSEVAKTSQDTHTHKTVPIKETKQKTEHNRLIQFCL